MENIKGHYRLALCLAAYDPYKDIFDIFIKQFEKYWPDRPYPLIIANMFFDYEGENAYVIHCGDVKIPNLRNRIVFDTVDADFFLVMEEDRILMDYIDNKEIEKILDFMDKEQIDYFRCQASQFKKKKKNRFTGYEHYYRIPMKEPYGVCGSMVIWRKSFLLDLRKDNLDNGYEWERYWLKQAYCRKQKLVDANFATDDRNVFHILHCIDKQKWIYGARKRLVKDGFDIGNSRKVMGIRERIFYNLKCFSKRVPISLRHGIKQFLKLIGFKFVTDY